MLCLLEKLPSFPTIFQKVGHGHQSNNMNSEFTNAKDV